MKTIYLDIETIPQSAEALEAMMPDEVRAPVMPAEIANPVEPDWQAKCPKYAGDAEKRDAWITAAVKKWATNSREAREKWQAQALENRARFVESAALRAESGHVKMIGLSVNGERTIYLWEPGRKAVDLAEKEATEQKVALFSPFPLEGMMFQRFARDFVAMMTGGTESALERQHRIESGESGFPRVVTYYGNTFDLPFLARRAAICGDPALMRFLRMHRRGRYLDATRFVDLHEEWTTGDRETKTGGLDGLCKMLGVEGKSAPCGGSFYKFYAENPGEGIVYLLRESAPCGGSFYKFYAENPGEGIVYLLRDLAATETCANKMGI